jgi:Short C-terminal domain/Phospholipase_D-nuclease N-terminal
VLGHSGPNGSDDERGIKVLAYDYPLLGMFWTFLLFFIWIAWIVVLFRVIFDIFRSKDLGGFGKALWVIFVILVPFLGVLVYLIARGHSMTERDVNEAKSQEEAFQTYVRQAASSSGGGSADELTKLAGLRDQGVITDDEFQAQKARLLA